MAARKKKATTRKTKRDGSKMLGKGLARGAAKKIKARKNTTDALMKDLFGM